MWLNWGKRGEALWSHGQGRGLREGWRIGATLGICHSGLVQRSRSQVVQTERPGFWRLSPLGLSHLPHSPLRCLYQSCFPTSLCSQLAAMARNLFFNVAFQLQIPLGLLQGCCIKRYLLPFLNTVLSAQWSSNTANRDPARKSRSEGTLPTVNLFFQTSFRARLTSLLFVK